ncbi:MAG: DUF167 domain-containing protein [Polaromonas sp.]|nr:DUF167 domain-containing protein [Polaromonas sp.]
MQAGRNGDVILHVQVVPNAPRTLADGLHGGPGSQALKVRLHAPPVDGKATDALLRWLANELGISGKAVALLRGKTSRRKQVCIAAEAVSQARWTALSRSLDQQ